MFNLSGSEILFLLLAGLVVLGPERLPSVLRQVGRIYGELRRMATGFEKEFKTTLAEPMDELRKSANEFTSIVNDDFGKVDPVPSPPMNSAKSQMPVDPSTTESSPSDSSSETSVEPSTQPLSPNESSTLESPEDPQP